MKKKLTLLATAVALGALVVVGATMAYFTSQDTATNVVTVGNVEIQINEDTVASKIDNIAAGVKEDDGSISYSNITPGALLSKIARVENTGKNSAFIRASVTMRYFRGEEEITALLKDVKPAIAIFNTEKWFQAEGDTTYYYYNGILESGKETENLIELIEIPSEWTNEMAGITVKAEVHAEAIQSDNLGTDPVAAFAGKTIE